VAARILLVQLRSERRLSSDACLRPDAIAAGCKAATPRAARLALGDGVIENERRILGVLSEADRRWLADLLRKLQVGLPSR
jgi:hypothetical protein